MRMLAEAASGQHDKPQLEYLFPDQIDWFWILKMQLRFGCESVKSLTSNAWELMTARPSYFFLGAWLTVVCQINR
jgi:hypothetical protein